MKPHFLFSLFFVLPGFGFAEPQPSYERFDILTAASGTHSRNPDWKPGKGLALEVSGMDWTADGRLAVTIRKGEVWFLDKVDGDSIEDITYHRFASGLHEPLGILRDGDSFLVAQRTEITRLRDTDGDDVSDEYLTAASGWNVSGNYHAYIYGPQRDREGNLWVTTNLDMGNLANNSAPWRGWALTMNPDTSLTPQAAGMRSPSGLGANLEGDLFFSDQQGSWIPTTPIYHLRRGAFYGNPEGIAPQDLEDSPLKLSAELPLKQLYPEAVKALPELVPPAVWLPYDKMGRSATDIQVIDQHGRFGPFDGQLLVGEFTNSSINRVFLEKVGGEYQGACFPFLSKFPAAVFRLTFGSDGSLYVGMTNRGWSSLGSRSYGLQRVRWNGEMTFAIQEMRAEPDGFELVFTEPVDPKTATNLDSYQLSSYTYRYQGTYGGPEEDRKTLKIQKATMSNDGLRIHLQIEGLREMYVHELRAEGLRNQAGGSLEHPDAYYTLNRIPE
tara:strand:- start:19039 stop:20535 length:1497 start_codon:yes stop_codon:yes gene_type:complete